MSPGTASGPSPRPVNGVREVDAHTLKSWIDAGDGVVLFDVREADEHARERIPGAALAALSRFDPRGVGASTGAGRTIVVHCKSGARAGDACRRLADAGIEAFSLGGGIDAWKKAGLATEGDPSAPIPIMRQVQIVVGALTVIGVALAWLVSPWCLILPAFLGCGLLFAGVTGVCGMAAMLLRMPWNRPANRTGIRPG